MLEHVPGARADVRAKVVDFSDTGIRIELSIALKPHHVVVVKGQAENVVPNGRERARVVDCRALSGGGYTVGLTFEMDEAARGKAGEKSKRREILEMLYAARRSDASQAAVSIHRMEERLGYPREQLEFTLWYLRESELVTCSGNSNALYSITPKGVDRVEADDADPNHSLIASGD